MGQMEMGYIFVFHLHDFVFAGFPITNGRVVCLGLFQVFNIEICLALDFSFFTQ
jgi:hypothetical protein